MNAKKVLVALLAVLALALAPSAAIATDGASDGAATASKAKKKGKSKSKSCKAKKKGKNKGKKSAGASAKNKKGGKKKGKSKKCGAKGMGGKAGAKLANGRYSDPKAELELKVSGGGGKIQLEQIAFLSCPVALAFGSDDSVPLTTRKGQAVAKQTFTVAGGAIANVSWSVAIDPDSLRYSLEYTLGWEIPSSDPEVPPVRCDDRGRSSGRLER